MVRPTLRTFLPFGMLAGVALILCLAMFVLFAVVDNAPWLSAFYNRYVLWVAASLHAGDFYWLLAFPFLVLWLSARTFHDRSPQDRNEKRFWVGISLFWGIAFLLGVIWIGAHSLLVASLAISAVPLILRWVPRRVEAIAATTLLCVLLGAAAWYLYWPWDYQRLYLWPLAPFLMLWGFIYLLLRANWMYVGMYGAGRRQLRQYLQRHPRAESYFELLSHLRQRPEGAVYDQKPVIERIAGPDRPPRGLLHRWQLGLLDRLITLEARWPWLARRLRKYSPAIGDSLIDSNPMLCGELEQLRGESLVAAEAILYGDGGELPAMDTSACQLAEDHFARWLAYSDALVECCLFDVKLGGEATTPGLRGRLVLAAEICAEAARRCVNPTLRRAPDGNATEWHWIQDRAVACDRALAFLRREILVLELLCGEKAKAPEERTLHELMGLLIAGGDRQARMLRLRLIAAVLHFHAIRGNMPGQSPRLLPTAPNWNRLADEVDRCCNDTLRLPAAQLATQPDFAHLPDEAFVVLAARRRFIDVCGHWLAEDLLTARMNCWPGHPQLNDWQRHDSFARGLVRLRTAGPPGGRTYSANLERACNDLRVSRQCSVRALAECLGGRAGNVVSAAANHARRDALAPTLVADRRAVWQKSVIPNLSFPTLGVCPRPNLFARIPTHLAAIAGTAMICILALGVRKDGWLESIDLRLGGQALHSPVNTVVAGRHSDTIASPWVGTQQDGVHVRATGRHHHWYQLTTDDGLLTNDVRRIAVGTDRVAYVCQKGPSRGLCLSDAPRSAPGTWASLDIPRDSWWTLLGFSAFDQIDARAVTSVRQTEDYPLLLMGTNNGRLGRYDVTRREWLSTIPVGSLLPGAAKIRDIATHRSGGAWHGFVATDNGLAGGSLLREQDEKIVHDGGQWTSIPGAKLLQPDVLQVNVDQLGDEQLAVAYVTVDGGLGSVPFAGGTLGDPVVHVAQDKVEGLSEKTVRRAVYDASSGRVWIVYQPAARGPLRVARYVEQTHGWTAGSEEHSAVHDLAVLPGFGGVLVGTDQGLVAVEDPAKPSTNLGPAEAAVLRIAMTDGPRGFHVLARDGQNRPSILFHGGDAHTKEFFPTIGPRRFPGITLDSIRAVEPDATGNRVFFGTADRGIALLNSVARDIDDPFAAATAASARKDALSHVRDLALAGNWLFQVSDDQVVDVINVEAGGSWKAVFNETAADFPTDRLTAAKAHQQQLFLGETAGNISSYDMETHRWSPVSSVPQLSELMSTGSALWALGGNDHRDLFQLTRKPEPAWELAFDQIIAKDAGPSRMLVIDKHGAIQLKTDAADPVSLVQPRFLSDNKQSPLLAALSDRFLYVAPVNGAPEMTAGGRADSVGRYDPESHEWSPIPLPPAAIGPPKQIHVNEAGLWLLDAAGTLVCTAIDGSGLAQPWPEVAVAQDVARVFWAQADATVLHENGSVALVRPSGQHKLIGDAFDAPLTAQLVDVIEFDGDILAAVGARIGRYHFADHQWTEITPAAGLPIRQLLGTASYAYALDSQGNLYRLAAGGDQNWVAVHQRMLDAKPVSGSQLVGRALNAGATNQLQIESIASLGAGLGVLVPGTGAFVLTDAEPDQPRWMYAETLGPPDSTEIVCAAEVADQLWIGTSDQGLWTYQACRRDEVSLPPMWVHVPLGAAPPSAIRRIVTTPESAEHVAVLTDNGAWHLQRKADGTWTPTQVGGAVAHLTLDATGLLWSEKHGESTQLIRRRFDENPSTLIGAANPQPGAPTVAVAVDPQDATLVRADGGGHVSAYASETRTWSDASVNSKGQVRELPVAAGSVWAWLPDSRTLARRSNSEWQEYPQRVHELDWTKNGLLLALDDGRIQLVGADDAVDVLGSAARGVFGSPWDAVTHLAELGPWLVVATKEAGVLAYHRADHRWRKIADQQLLQIETGQVDGEGNPLAYFALDSTGTVTWLATADDAPALHPVGIPAGQAVRQLVPTQGDMLALTADQILRVAAPGNAATVIRNPQPLEIAELPPIRAATQFGSTLLLSLAAMGDQTSRIASYDPASQRWETLAVPQGVVTRFHEIGPAGARRLFAEITPTKANPLAAEPLASEMDLRQLVEMCSSAEAGPSWTCRPVDGQWLDIDSDSLSLMAIDAEHRLHRYSMADNTFIDAGLTGRETLPADIRAARGVEDELVALLEDQTLWCYSLRTLRWTHQEPDRKFAALVVAGNQLYAIDADSGNFLEYATEDDDRKWRPLAKPAGVFDDTVYLDGQHQKRNDQWQSVGAKSYSWRPSDPKARLATIAIEKGRFDFNRYRRLAVRGGTVWLQTLAERDGHPVCRELRTGAAELDEVAVGDERFAVAHDEVAVRFLRPSAVEFDKGLFRIRRLAAGSCSSIDIDGTTAPCEIHRKLGEQYVATPFVPVGTGYAFDLDVWTELAAVDDRLVAATHGGLLGCQYDRQQLSVDSAHRTPRVIADLAFDGDRLVAQVGADAYVTFDSGWKECDQQQAATVFANAASLLASNSQLVNWRVSGSAAQPVLQLRTGPDTTATVTLREGGFGFDDVRGLQLTDNQICLYTADGKVTYPCHPFDREAMQIDTTFAVSFDSLARAYQKQQSNTVVLWASDPAARQAYAFEEGTWQRLDEDEYARELEQRRETLYRDNQWQWKSGESVVMTADGSDKKIAIQGHYDYRIGQFSFDTVRDVVLQKGRAWVVTDGGVLHYVDDRLTAFDLGQSTPFAENVPITARLVKRLAGNWYLEARCENASPHWFEHRADGWQAPDDTDPIVEEIREADRWLVHGRLWRGLAAECRPTDNTIPPQLQLATQSGGDTFISVPLRNRTWALDQMQAIGGTIAQPVVGSNIGLCRIAPEDPTRANWLIAATDAAVTRIERVGAELQIATSDGNEHMVELKGLQKSGEPKQPLTALDRQLLAADRWKWSRDEQNQLQIQVRFAEKGVWRTTQFGRGRFDFDRVSSVANDAQHVWLATDGGFFEIDPTIKNSFRPSDSLQMTAAANQPHFFSVWFEGSNKLYVDVDANTLLQFDGQQWGAIDTSRAELVRGARNDLAAANDRWEIRKAGESLAYRLLVGDSFRTLVFSPPLGGFTCDSFQDLRFHSDSKLVLVATLGGICGYDADGKWINLHDDLDGDQQPDAVRNLYRTEKGLICSLGGTTPSFFLLTGEQIPEHTWAPLDADAATALIKAHAAKVDHDENGWTATLDPDKPPGSQKYALRWCDQTLQLQPGANARFAHDQVKAISAAENALWLATEAGMVRMSLQPLDGTIRRESGQHLWTACGEVGLEPFEIGRFPAAQGGFVLICRAQGPAGENRLFYDVESTQWKPLGEESDAVDPEILCNVPGYWQWRKTGEASIEVILDPDAFQVPRDFCASRLFEAGTLAFWNVDHSVASDGDPVAFADDWFIATAAGVLQLEGSSRKFKRLHGLASDGTALQHVTDLTTTDTGAGPQLWCRTADPVGIYKFHQNQWTETKESFPHRRTREVSSKWLKFQATDAGQMEIRMSESSTDDREHMRGPQLFLDGRFRFDVVKHMVTRGDSFWLSTPAGIVQLNRSNGSIRHYAKPFGTSPDIRTLHNVQNSLFAVDAQEQVWTWEKQWRQHGADEALLAKLREVADNPLFRCRLAAPDDYVFHFAVGDMPAVRLNDPQFPLLKAGVFAFDDLRDVWFDKDDQLLASTRMGIWNYDLRGDTRRVEPTDAHFLARLGDGTRHAAMDELGLFFTSHVSPHDATVFDASHERAFKRTIGGEWVAVDPASVRPAQHRSIPIAGARTYEFHNDVAGRLVGQAHRGNQSAGRPSIWPANGAQPNAWAHNFSDIVSTGDAIWAPLKERLLWIRASAL